MGHSAVWNSHSKTYGPGSRACRVCGNVHAVIRKYGLMCCRQCFRSNAKEIGFLKFVGVGELNSGACPSSCAAIGVAISGLSALIKS